MFFRHNRGGRGFLARLSRRRHLSGILSLTELEQVFQRELARVERSGRTFSLVVFPPKHDDEREIPDLVRILADRTRASDIVGYVDSTRIAVLLPETGGAGAWTFAEDVLARLADENLKFQCEVYSYPSEDHGGDVGAVERRGRSSGDPPSGLRRVGGGGPMETESAAVQATLEMALPAARRVGAIEPLLLHPLPLWKRVMDVAVSSTLLLVLSPLFALAALAIKLTSPGPAIFSQLRAGHGGRPFTFYKFRSMYVDAEQHKDALRPHNEAGKTIFKIRNDRRITPVGRWLRRTSIDELPQLWNVLKGDMTLVGPRPPTLDEVPNYERWQRRRLAAPVGLTCIREVSGRSEVPFEDWVRMDLRYLAQRSFWMDLKLMFRTVFAVVSGRGAY